LTATGYRVLNWGSISSEGHAVAIEGTDTAFERAPHAVQFYEQNDRLTEVVGRYLAGGLAGHATAIAIATEAHRRALEAELARAGLDPDELRRTGRLLTLDAAETLVALRDADGRIDREAFERVIGSVVRDASAAGTPVVAFGEMVALLWEAGDVGGAIELEKLCNDLCAHVDFSLVCGYRSAWASDPRQREALEAVCELHSAVLDPPGPALDVVSGRFDPVLTAPAHARRLLLTAIRGRDPHPDRLLDAQLVMSELATNAVRHARTDFWVTVRREHARVAISVRDGSGAQPIVREPGPEALSGRGLRLVGEIAEAWGIEWTATGKTVWARLRL
jgi:anti-sigma regulatory factor (Ser/Thr protein kinase)